LDGHHAAESARGRGAPTFPVHRSEDLHRLPQGHRAPPARHAQCSEMAVILSGALILASIFILVAGSTPPAIAKDSDAWLIKGRLFGKNGKIATNVSGIA